MQRFRTNLLLTTVIWREKLRKLCSNKIRENATVLYYFAVDNFDLTRKIVEIILHTWSLKTIMVSSCSS